MTPQRILTIRLGAVGDVLTTLPAIKALRALRPNALIHHLVEEGAADVVRDLPELDDVIVIPRAALQRELRSLRFGAFRGVWRDLRARKFDFVVDFQNLMRSAVWKVATGAKHGVVRSHWQELSPLFFDHRVDCDPNDNMVQQHADLLRVLTPDNARPPLQACAPAVSDEAHRLAEECLRARGISGRYVVVAPGSRWPRRSLPERIITSGSRRLKARGVQQLLIGGPNERGWLEPLAQRLDVPFSVDLPLKPLFAVIQRASGIFCADSAPLHAADMFELPTAAVFGPSAPELYGPVFAPSFVVRDEKYRGQHSFRGKDIDYFAAVSDQAIEDGIEAMLAVVPQRRAHGA